MSCQIGSQQARKKLFCEFPINIKLSKITGEFPEETAYFYTQLENV